MSSAGVSLPVSFDIDLQSLPIDDDRIDAL
jgi:hypothetical protein